MERKIDEAAVWKRVTAASTQSTEPVRAATPSPQQALLNALITGRTLAGAYEALRRSGRSAYNEFARGQQRENRLLRGLYFLHTGQTPHLPEAIPRRVPKELYVSRLRWLLETQDAQQAALKSLSEKSSGQTANILADLSQKAAQRWEGLLSELAGQLT